MTPSRATTSHVVVDGSNIATEGRKVPSLAQLVEAVEQFLADRPHDLVTVICDASFPNRIDESEKQRYEQLLEQGWLITPPAGAIGRGDAFILQVGAKGGASVLSNDSFQEFHGQHSWLFDEGRLVGGKPVAGVGWIFVDRVPVRGPASRKSVRNASRTETTADPTEQDQTTEGSKKVAPKKRVRKKAAAKKSEPESSVSTKRTAAKKTASKGTAKKSTTRKRAPKRAASSDSQPEDEADDGTLTESTRKRRARKAVSGQGQGSDVAADAAAPSGEGGEQSNSLESYERFAAANPVGSEVVATVVSFGSHGANARVGDVNCYVPTKLLGDPPPRTAKDVLSLDEERAFVVAALYPEKNGVDLGLAPPKPVRRTRKKPASTVKRTRVKRTASPK